MRSKERSVEWEEEGSRWYGIASTRIKQAEVGQIVRKCKEEAEVKFSVWR